MASGNNDKAVRATDRQVCLRSVLCVPWPRSHPAGARSPVGMRDDENTVHWSAVGSWRRAGRLRESRPASQLDRKGALRLDLGDT